MKIKADEILTKAAGHIAQRAASRDKKDGERSMARCVAAFNSMYGKDLTEEQGWQFMTMLKMARASAGGYNPDDYEDGAAYFALAGECAGARDEERIVAKQREDVRLQSNSALNHYLGMAQESKILAGAYAANVKY